MAAQDPDQARLRRKFNAAQRLQMARLAAERFRSPDLREIEAAAKAHATDLIYRDATAVPKKDLTVLRKYGYTRIVGGFELPLEIGFREDGVRKFELPNGDLVERKGGKTKILRAPNGDDDYDLPRFCRWSEAISLDPERTKSYKHQGEGRQITLPKEVELPGSGTRVASGDYVTMRSDEDTKGRITFDSVHRDFLTDEAHRAIVAYFIAADARICAERKLIVSAIKVIGSCTTYGQALDFWPEVQELEEAMFGKAIIPAAFSLVALTDEDKKALCANMASRGVAGAACDRLAA